MTVPIRVMIVDDDPDRGSWVASRLEEDLYQTMLVCMDQHALLRHITQLSPDVIVIDMQSPGRDILESLAVVTEHQPVPILMYSAEDDPKFIRRAVESGVTAYMVGDIQTTQVQAAIDAAMIQFEAFQSLRSSLEKTRDELDEHRFVDRAKKILMERHNLSEDEAYRELRQIAMQQRKSLGKLAAELIALEEQTR